MVAVCTCFINRRGSSIRGQNFRAQASNHEIQENIAPENNPQYLVYYILAIYPDLRWSINGHRQHVHM